jgi:hypothetical protein
MVDGNIYRFGDEEAMTARQEWRVLHSWKRFEPERLPY